MSINVGQRQPMSAVSSQSRPWSKIWRQPVESRRNLLPFNSNLQFLFGDRHLESVVSNVGRHRDIDIVILRLALFTNVGVAVGVICLCCWKLKIYRPAEIISDFSMEVVLVFQVSPGTEGRYIHALYAQRSGIGPLGNRFLTLYF